MQSAHRRTSKKRKPDADLEAERSLYASFATAANAVSQLYSLSLSQQARHRDEGARQSLVRRASMPRPVCRSPRCVPPIPRVANPFRPRRSASTSGSAKSMGTAPRCPPRP